MTSRDARRRRRALWGCLTTLALAAVACARNAPQDALSPSGPVARDADKLFRPVFWIAAAIFFLVEGGLVYVIIRYRRRSDRDAPVQIHGNKRLEIVWTIIPALLLAVIAIFVSVSIFDVAARPVGSTTINVNVTAHQWWWEYEYTDFKTTEGTNLKTANELVIPADRWVYLTMTSTDVIHSYWVPKLAGKQDVTPGRTTNLKLRADAPGVYRGQCAEFCALSHANMRLRVIAQAPDDFATWLRGQLDPAALQPTGSVLAKLQNTCAQCHTIRGVRGVGGTTAPDLTHFASRESFAGSMLDLVPAEAGRANLEAWLRDPPAIKPGIPFPDGPMMPDYNLTEEEIDSLVAYLMSLT